MLAGSFRRDHSRGHSFTLERSTYGGGAQYSSQLVEGVFELVVAV